MKTVKSDQLMQIAQEAAEKHMREHKDQPYVPLSLLSLVVDKAVRKAGLRNNLFRYQGLYSLTAPAASYTRWIKNRSRGQLAVSNPHHRFTQANATTPARATTNHQGTPAPKRIRVHPNQTRTRVGSRGTGEEND